MGFDVTSLKLNGLKLITPFYMEDERGCFIKYFEKEKFKKMGINIEVMEAFETTSCKNVIRGLHFQDFEPQGKLVRVIKGEIMDVAVDLRKGSETFGQWEAVELSEDNHRIFWIPKGFAHGFVVRSEYAIVSYSCDGKYHNKHDTGIIWNDEEIGINWNVKKPILSDKDRNLMSLKDYMANRDKYYSL